LYSTSPPPPLPLNTEEAYAYCMHCCRCRLQAVQPTAPAMMEASDNAEAGINNTLNKEYIKTIEKYMTEEKL
jgi:hypothetical protein